MQSSEIQRLISFIVLSVAILLAWGYVFPVKPAEKPAAKNGSTTKPVTRSNSAAASRPSSRPSMARSASLPSSAPSSRKAVQNNSPKMAKVKPATAPFKNDFFLASVTNQGGGLSSFVVKKFFTDPKTKDKMMNLISKEVGKNPPFTERLLDESLVKHDRVYYKLEKSDKANVIRMIGKVPSKHGGFVKIVKTYTFDEKEYKFQVGYELSNHTSKTINTKIALILKDQRDLSTLSSGGMFSVPQVFQSVCRLDQESKPERTDVKALAEEKSPSKIFTAKEDVKYFGIDQRYFLMAIVPHWGKGNRGAACHFEAKKNGWITVEARDKGVELAVGKVFSAGYTGFLGPKYFDQLKGVGGSLESSVDFGIFAFICRPMLWLLQKFYNFLFGFGFGNWGIAIILLTLLVKGGLLPLTHRSMSSMKKMQNIKPEMDKLKAKYGGDKETLNREMMNLYVKHGINPIGGCLPMVLQMPIWIALYQTLFYAVELYQAPFFPGWIDDLSAKDPFYILPVMLGIAMFFQQKFTPQTMDAMQAKIMAYAMPIFFTSIMLFLPSGLTLYIFVNTVLSMAHHIYIHKSPDEPSKPQKKAKPGFMARMQKYVDKQKKA